MELIQYPQEQCGQGLREKIAALERTAWPEGGTDFPTSPDTYVTSFVLLEGGEAVCHVGVRKSSLLHKGQTYQAYGLSEVVTHPQYQGRGLASGLIRRAARFIVDQRPDLSIFTCAESRVGLYERGGWEAVRSACFVGGTREKPFRSDSLGLVTMIMLLSDHGKRHRADFEDSDIVFELGEKQLW